ncbi:hypothetical protein, partial [Pseudomonas frederiksbergensis]|uniref:hypothetical protein n=1 Tax=Pseudomonas frederiksbergensis TaxID=104087 RepID=UPI001C838B11
EQGLPAKAVGQSTELLNVMALSRASLAPTRVLRRSQILGSTQTHCGSELAREEAVTFNISVD